MVELMVKVAPGLSTISPGPLLTAVAVATGVEVLLEMVSVCCALAPRPKNASGATAAAAIKRLRIRPAFQYRLGF